MTYEHIATFLSVVTYNNISAAARNLYVSQSTVSTRIRQLEEELGAPLLIRHKGIRTVELTAYGKAFIPIANQWASLWKNTQHIKTLEAVVQLRIASIDAVNNYTFIPLFQKHLEDHSKIKLSINTHHSNEIYSLVENRAADIGFVFSRITYPDIIVSPIYRELMYLICHKDSDYHDDLSCHDLDVSHEVYLNWGVDYQQWHDMHWSPELYPLITVNTGSMLQRYLTVLNRWSIAPMSVIEGAIRNNPHLTYYTLHEPPAPRICYEIKNRYPNASLSQAIEILDEEIRDFIDHDQSICTFEEWMLQGQ